MTIQVKNAHLYMSGLDQSTEYVIRNEDHCIGVARINYSYEVTIVYISALLIFILSNRKEKNVII
jgi:hypothetical protein